MEYPQLEGLNVAIRVGIAEFELLGLFGDDEIGDVKALEAWEDCGALTAVEGELVSFCRCVLFLLESFWKTEGAGGGAR